MEQNGFVDPDRVVQTGPNSWTLLTPKKAPSKGGEEARTYLTRTDNMRITNLLRDVEDVVRDIPVRASKKVLDDALKIVRKKVGDVRFVLEPEDE